MAIRSGLGHYANAPTEAAVEDTRPRDTARRADMAGGLSANPYSNPTDYRNWSQVYGANAGVANRAATGLAGAVAGQTADARTAQRSAYGEFQQGVAQGAQGGVAKNADGSYDLSGSYAPSVYGGSGAPGYDGPTGYANDYAYGLSQGAQTAAGQLGTTGGVQGAMGPGTSMFGALLTNTAGRSQFGAQQRNAAASGREYDAAQARGSEAVSAARSSATQSQRDYERYLAELATEYWNRMGGALAADPSSQTPITQSTRPAPSMYSLQNLQKDQQEDEWYRQRGYT